MPLREPDDPDESDEPGDELRVRLGFADGSSVNLDRDSREAAAIRAAAARLINEPR